ncbi:MAG: hypothetical protein D6715_10235 [Calditrichaeota bacterium]|nr:MAG: hypothetical protein D6715_10235 [Calditrichota bacterium]
MILAKVRGEIYSTINHPFYDGRKLLVVDVLDGERQPTGKYLIAIDAVDAGVGQTVLVIDEGNSARQLTGQAGAPVRSVIIGIVDHVEMDH